MISPLEEQCMDEEVTFLSLSEYIFKEISKDILGGMYKPGHKLVEGIFQEKYKVSKSPIREAFQMLINSGLVERKARRGCFVKNIESSEIINNYTIRKLLEGYAAKEAYLVFGEDEAKKLQEFYDAMHKDAYEGDSISYNNHHNEFQGLFSRVSGNQTLAEICEKLRFQNMWYRMQYYELNLLEDLHTHDELVRHFVKRDLKPEEAQKLMEDHVSAGLENFLRFCVEEEL